MCLFTGVFGKQEGWFWLLQAGSNKKSQDMLCNDFPETY